MEKFRADLHIHTVLSPCADLEMTPANIVARAKSAGLNIIGITDHNSTLHAKLVKKLAEKEGIFVLTGAEVTTKEEVHCLVFFEDEVELDLFQTFLETRIIKMPNPKGHFGYQPVIDESENILEIIPYLLSAALNAGIYEIEKYVHQRNGIFIPAHVNRPSNGIFGQLGFIPSGLVCDALGVFKHNSEKDVRKHYVFGKEMTLIRNSDAHFLNQIGEIYSTFYLEKISFSEIKMALNQVDKRFVEIV